MPQASPPVADRTQPPAWVTRVGRVSWSFVGAVIAIGLLVLGMVWLRELVIPLILAAYLAAVFEPMVSWLKGRKVPRGLGALLVIVVVAAAILGALAIAVNGIVERGDELTGWFDEADEQLEVLLDRWNLTGLVDNLNDRLGEAGPTLGGGLGAGVSSAVGSLVSLASGLVLGVVLLYYLLRDGPMLADRAVARVSNQQSDRARRLVRMSVGSVRQYFRGRSILAVVQGLAVALALWALGVPLPFAIGLVNIIGAYIPYLGAFVGGAFAVLMGLAGGGTSLALAALGVVLFVNLVLENVLEPALMGSSLQMHPIMVLLVTVGGGVVAGIVGLVLAAPTAAVAIQFGRELKASDFFTPQHVTAGSSADDPPAADPPASDPPAADQSATGEPAGDAADR